MNKILTISIAAYNVEKFLNQVLDSLIEEQVLDDLEVLVISDGSTDNTVNIANTYVEKYPDTFKVVEKENGGWGSTVNKGMELATGKYFKLLDGDDWFYTENLPSFFEYLKSTEADMVLSAFGMYDDSLGRVYALKEMPFDKDKLYNFEDVANACDIQMHGFAIKTDIVKKANIHIVDHCFYTDTQFVAELFVHADTMIYFDQPIYCYRIGRDGQSVSAAGLLKHMGDNRRVAKELLSYKKKLDLTPNKEKAYMAKTNYAITMEYYSYCALKSEERKVKVKELGQFIRDNQIVFSPLSAEVKVNLIFRYKGTAFIHGCFELARKVGKLLHVDLVQHAK